MASVEAFANEVLSSQYLFSESRLRHMSLIGEPDRKVDTLLALLGLSSDCEWFRILRDEQVLRSDRIVHFKPTYVDSDDLAVTPLTPSDVPDHADLLVSAVHDFHVAIFSSYGQPVSETHWGWAASAKAYSALLDGAAT